VERKGKQVSKKKRKRALRIGLREPERGEAKEGSTTFPSA